MEVKLVSPEEESAIKMAFRLDPYILTGSPYCSVPASGQDHNYCTRPQGHEGPHICIVHYNAEARAKGMNMIPQLRNIWY